MYFLSEEERKQLARLYLPRTREAGVAEELRGWNWDQPPLQPIYEVPLGVFEVAGHYCSKDRDLYFRRVEHRVGSPTRPMAEGKILHQLMARMVTLSKRYIYSEGIERLNGLSAYVEKEALAWLLEQHAGGASVWPNEWWEETLERAKALLRFEVERIWSRIQEVLLHQPYIEEDSLAASAIPVVVEQKLNGSFLGLSAMLSTDALTYSEPIVVDLKFGPRRDFNRLATTGYALALEALHDFPVNIGCIVYAQYKNGRWLIERDLHVIGDELRQRFVEERDEKMRLVYEEIDPGHEINCRVECAYTAECLG
ncbi:MAG: type I-A CRISPR-associated protein Cas4/Csa1 [Desulfitobacteriaceae bacterium]